MENKKFVLFDVHTHTNFAAFDKDRDEVVCRALEAGIGIINVGTQRNTSALAVKMTEKYKQGVYACVGLHPIHTTRSYYDPAELGGGKGFFSKAESFDYRYYLSLAGHPRVVAIGECGFDYFRLNKDDLETKKRQKQAFLLQIKLALEIRKPLMIHCRPQKDNDAYYDLLEIIDSSGYRSIPAGIVHFFVGSKDIADEFIKRGFYFSFGGVISFTHSYDEVVRYIPMERILLETDAPYVAPAPYRGRRNEPLYVKQVAKRLAELKEIDFVDVARISSKNVHDVFLAKLSE